MRHTSSFRDNSGFIFVKNDEVFRIVNSSYSDEYDMLINSGFYERLTKAGALIPHVEVERSVVDDNSSDIYKVLKPQKVDFISYPYEWCFSQLRDAALLTLEINKTALEYGMVLKDASAYNIQFINGKPVLIDTLSFERFEEKPWAAYRQFCEHFLAPLALMSFRDVRLNQLLKSNIDGIPLDIAGKLLPFSARMKPGIYLHLIVHSKLQNKYSSKNKKITAPKYSAKALAGLIMSLKATIKGMTYVNRTKTWDEYTGTINRQYYDEKKFLTGKYITLSKAKIAWDIGCNTGEISKICAQKGIKTIAFDNDHDSIEKFYKSIREEKAQNILPLVIDINNPSPAIGWNNQERMSLNERQKPGLVIFLALIHHLVVGNNISFEKLSETLKNISPWLIIEFVSNEDEMFKRLIINRKFDEELYSVEKFEEAFIKHFRILEKAKLKNGQRTIYLMKRHEV